MPLSLKNGRTVLRSCRACAELCACVGGADYGPPQKQIEELRAPLKPACIDHGNGLGTPSSNDAVRSIQSMAITGNSDKPGGDMFYAGGGRRCPRAFI